VGRRSARLGCQSVPDGVRDIGLYRFAKPSLEHEWPGTGRRSGSRLSLLAGRALRWLWERLEKRWNLLLLKVPAPHGRLNATQPGVLAVSHPYIRGLVAPCKGSVAKLQHLLLFTETVLKGG
jgi:hypothetical protein